MEPSIAQRRESEKKRKSIPFCPCELLLDLNVSRRIPWRRRLCRESLSPPYRCVIKFYRLSLLSYFVKKQAIMHRSTTENNCYDTNCWDSIVLH